MGALHEGHLALIRRAAETALPVVVSIFVNPTQFGPGEDFERYPRTLEADLQAAASVGADIVFTPRREHVYPAGVEVPVPPLPRVATEPGLEDAHRPGHFAGVCQVVARLFDLVKPTFAVFGEKDYQQLRVIESMASEQSGRWPRLKIEAHPTLRDPDGLAISSRNRYLSPQQRRRALAIPRALEAAAAVEAADEAEACMQAVLRSEALEVDYAAVRHHITLMPIEGSIRSARALIAARVDNVRLIDNCAMGRDPSEGEAS